MYRVIQNLFNPGKSLSHIEAADFFLTDFIPSIFKNRLPGSIAEISASMHIAISQVNPHGQGYPSFLFETIPLIPEEIIKKQVGVAFNKLWDEWKELQKGHISSPVSESKEQSRPTIRRELGGIDFRSLPIVTQAIGNLSANLRDSPLRGQSLRSINLAEEWSQIERLVSSGITPSSERLKEYIQTSCTQDNITQDRNKILLCISDILRLQEERCQSTNPTLRDILVVLEAHQNSEQLKEVFLGKKTLPS